MMKTSIDHSFFFLFAIALFLVACGDMADDHEPIDGRAEYDLSSSDGGGAGGGSQGGDSTNIDPGQITAGEWNDLANWGYWQDLYQTEDFKNMHVHWGYDLNPRVSVHIQNPGEQPVSGVSAQLKTNEGEVVWESVSDRHGMLHLWPGAYELSELTLNIGGDTFQPKAFQDGAMEIEIDALPPDQSTIEVAFIVDATGSMADELEYLKVELMDVMEEVEQRSSKTVVSGSVFYRDEGDEYVTRVSAFTNEPSRTVDFIQDQKADGGGDWPEAVHTALDKAINELQWSSGKNTKLAFILLDAPPHYTDEVLVKIHQLIKDFSREGIKLIPVAASGIDKETEFLLRYFAISTNGTYVFITNHSGIGNEHIEPSVGDYEVEYLNDLITRLILEETQN